jgi:hypothetical protein
MRLVGEWRRGLANISHFCDPDRNRPSGVSMNRPLPHRAGVYMAILQFVFTLGWTTYAIYLPQLVTAVGLPRSAVLWILMLDQAVFTATDFAMGVAADKVARVVGRLGTMVAAIAVVSGAAFIALPMIARGGEGLAAVFLIMTIVWTVTSSALRAPPLMLLGKYAARPAIPYLASLTLVGYGIAGALAPYLATALRELDPRFPFIIASLAVTATALALSRVERSLAASAAEADAIPSPEPVRNQRTLASVALFGGALLLLALGFQIHTAVNSSPLYLRFATPRDLDLLMPIFWVGFNVAMFPVSLLTKRMGGFRVMGGGALVGAAALMMAELAGNLGFLAVAQLIAGAAWGALLMSAFAAAIALGSTGAEGRVLGLLFSTLALATLARFAVVASGLAGDPVLKMVLNWLPAALWASGGGLLIAAVLTAWFRSAGRADDKAA